MVGFHGMAPAPIDLSDRIADPEEREEAEKEVDGALRAARRQDHAPLGSGMIDGNPYGETLGDRDKRRLVAGLLGQALRRRLEHDPAQPGRHASSRRAADRRAASSTATT